MSASKVFMEGGSKRSKAKEVPNTTPTNHLFNSTLLRSTVELAERIGDTTLFEDLRRGIDNDIPMPPSVEALVMKRLEAEAIPKEAINNITIPVDLVEETTQLPADQSMKIIPVGEDFYYEKDVVGKKPRKNSVKLVTARSIVGGYYSPYSPRHLGSTFSYSPSRTAYEEVYTLTPKK